MSVLQLLLGNIGIPGGGVNALRGEPNVQGATDRGMLVHEHPAYLKWSNTTDRSSLRKWLESQTYSDGYYANKSKFLISSLKEWFGENATVDNDYGYDWWPKVPSGPGAQDYTHISTFELMDRGVIKGYFNWGMNPCHSAPNASFVRCSMAKLDWLVVADQVATESATFWKAPDMDPAEIDTTVYFLPCALIYEKPGTILNSGRWLQWRYQAVESWDEAKPDYEMCDLIWTAICDLHRKEGGANPAPILNTKWDYYVDGIENGLAPACVATCQPGALEFGDRDEMIARARERVAMLKERGYENAVIYGEEEMGGLHVIQVLKYGVGAHGQVASPAVNPAGQLTQIMKPVTGAVTGLTVAGLAAMFALGVGYKRDKRAYNVETADTLDVETGEVIKHGDGQDPESVKEHILGNLPRKKGGDHE